MRSILTAILSAAVLAACGNHYESTSHEGPLYNQDPPKPKKLPLTELEQECDSLSSRSSSLGNCLTETEKDVPVTEWDDWVFADGTWSGGGGTIEYFAHNPWFLTHNDRTVSYCVNMGSSISISKNRAVQMISEVIEDWQKTFESMTVDKTSAAFLDGERKTIATNFAYNDYCDELTDLEFLLGEFTGQDGTRTSHLTGSFGAYSQKERYSPYTGWSRGFIWLSPDIGQNAINPDSKLYGFDFIIKGILNHELGHVFGLRHTNEIKFMQDFYVLDLLNQDASSPGFNNKGKIIAKESSPKVLPYFTRNLRESAHKKLFGSTDILECVNYGGYDEYHALVPMNISCDHKLCAERTLTCEKGSLPGSSNVIEEDNECHVTASNYRYQRFFPEVLITENENRFKNKVYRLCIANAFVDALEWDEHFMKIIDRDEFESHPSLRIMEADLDLTSETTFASIDLSGNIGRAGGTDYININFYSNSPAGGTRITSDAILGRYNFNSFTRMDNGDNYELSFDEYILILRHMDSESIVTLGSGEFYSNSFYTTYRFQE